ncbi:MAG: hypothetical protein IJX09_02325 [Clostridia bacterium]|nr:hypothetical protein [Clostridia bacterium]
MRYDIIVQGGQSNAEGTGCGPVARELPISPNVWYLDAEKTVEVGEDNMIITYADKPFQIVPAAERVVNGNVTGDFSLTFAEEYEKARLLQADRKLLIVRAAIGGTGFKKNHWGIGKVLYNKLLEMTDYALSLHPENRVIGFLWHQGEHDAFEGSEPNEFKAQLTAQLHDFRARYGEDIPFIAGDFAREWKSKNEEICRPIVQKIRDLTAEEKHCAFVETADLLSNNETLQNGDDIHFSRQSLHLLGERYFQAFQSIKNN